MTTMFTAQECRERAQQCAEAARTAEGTDRSELIRLANDWLILSDLVAKRFPSPFESAH